MMCRRNVLLGLLAIAITVTGCRKDEDDLGTSAQDEALSEALRNASPNGSLDHFILPESNDYAAIPQDPLNPITSQKIALGRMLFHETGLGTEATNDQGLRTFSCASCHHAAAGFQAGTAQGIGEGGVGFGAAGEQRFLDPTYEEDEADVQQIRTPSAMNSAYQTNMLWNGQFGATGVNVGTEAQWTPETPLATNELGYEGIETQAIAGLGVHRLAINEALMSELGYKSLFDLAFPDVNYQERYSREYAGLAIAAYERVILANRAPFQRWLRGEMLAMSDKEKEGAALFFGKANCASCHNGPALNSMEFHALGMKDLSDCADEVVMRNPDANENLGRGGFTGNAEDNYKFKVPQLYNLANSPMLGHGSSFYSIQEVVEYKNNGIAENENVPESSLSPDFGPKGLSQAEVDAIVTFISSGLYDPDLDRYAPDDLYSGNCFPNADSQSSQDLGCD